MDGGQAAYGERTVYGDVGFRKVLIISVVFHLLVLVGLPLMGKLFVKTKKFERPKTFQLVQMPPSQPPQRKVPVEPAPVEPPPTPVPPEPIPEPTPAPVPTPAPKPKPTPPEPKPQPPKPTPKRETVSKPVEEDVSELAAIMNAMPMPATQISAPSDFKYHWYLDMVRRKIESNWRPGTENTKISVVVSFEILSDGSTHAIRVTSSSGDASIDKLGERAVMVSSPFVKLPPDFAGDRVAINFTLRPTRKQ
jgi:periplasmic protein TonB